MTTQTKVKVAEMVVNSIPLFAGVLQIIGAVCWLIVAFSK